MPSDLGSLQATNLIALRGSLLVGGIIIMSSELKVDELPCGKKIPVAVTNSKLYYKSRGKYKTM